ncbi:hypothetical protein AM233_04585 [Bacillus sp. FJAT-22058]|nr:hypothetical protein AM233_04585 [Bacillus sp. FJAT-22058]
MEKIEHFKRKMEEKNNEQSRIEIEIEKARETLDNLIKTKEKIQWEKKFYQAKIFEELGEIGTRSTDS